VLLNLLMSIEARSPSHSEQSQALGLTVTAVHLPKEQAKAIDGPVSKAFGVDLKVGRQGFTVDGERAEAVALGLTHVLQGVVRRERGIGVMDPVTRGNDKGRVIFFAANSLRRSEIDETVDYARDVTNDILAGVQSPHRLPPETQSEATDAAIGMNILPVTAAEVPEAARQRIARQLCEVQGGGTYAVYGVGWNISGGGAGHAGKGVAGFMDSMAATQGHAKDGLRAMHLGHLDGALASVVLVSTGLHGPALDVAAKALVPHVNQILKQIDSPYQLSPVPEQPAAAS
jgi:hypothetical protein